MSQSGSIVGGVDGRPRAGGAEQAPAGARGPSGLGGGLIPRSLWAAFLAGVAIVAFMAAVRLWANHVLVANQRRVAQSYELIAELETLFSSVKDAETGQRGYLLTGREEYLEPYESASAAVAARLAHTRELAEREGTLGPRLDEVAALIEAKQRELGLTVRLWREGDFEQARRVVLSGEGKAYMDRLREALSAVRRDEERALERRREESGRATLLAQAVSVLSTAFSLLLLGALFVTARRELSERRRAEGEVRALASDLERRVMDRTLELSAANELLAGEVRERARAEGEARTLARVLQDSNVELEAFAHTISHDLRAPLRHMHSYAEALLEDYGPALGEDGARYAGRIVASSKRMEELVQDLLEYARLSRGEFELKRVPLGDVVAEALEVLEADRKQAGGAIEAAGPLPWVRGHRATLVRVMTNLVGNALKFTRPGRAPRVTVSAERRGGRVRLWIEDEGIGVEPEHRERVFRVFERLHGQEAYPGTGIGLAIVRRGVERMGGASGVEGAPGGGSRFWIELEAAEGEGAGR
ncbi:MAG TPA: CHASE3 domain-containing protein [Polyangiaceae bacterium]|nr:CHASE3 domain-containing protein [Polyangiaceae bacterium]